MKLILVFLFTFLLMLGCKKVKTRTCYTEVGIGRIIGYDPCGHYKAPNKVFGAGFVLEIDRGISKDSVVTYQIPEGLFEFPVIDYWATANGAFLFPIELQNRYKISFTYKVATGNDKEGYVCSGNVNLGPYNQAVKERQILVSCISKR